MKIMKNTHLYSTKLFLYSYKLLKLKFIIFQVWKLKHNYIILNILEVKVTQSHPTLCDPMDYTVHGILQARILEWIAFPFSRSSPQPRDRTHVSCIAGKFFTSWAITSWTNLKLIFYGLLNIKKNFKNEYWKYYYKAYMLLFLKHFLLLHSRVALSLSHFNEHEQWVILMFLFFKLILFIYFWLCWVSLLHWFSPVAVSGDYFLVAVSGLLTEVACLVVEHGL